MKEEKFYDKIKGSLLYKTTEGKHKTLDEYIEDNKEETYARDSIRLIKTEVGLFLKRRVS